MRVNPNACHTALLTTRDPPGYKNMHRVCLLVVI